MEKIRQLDTFSVSSKGTFMKVPYAMTAYWRAPDALSEWMESKQPATTWVADRCWQRFGAVIVDCNGSLAQHGKNHHFGIRAAHLYHLLDDDVEMIKAPDEKFGGAVRTKIVAVDGRGAASVALFFDPQTALLAGYEQTAVFSGIPMKTTVTITSRMEVGGLKLPKGQTVAMDGEVGIEETVTSYSLAPPNEQWFQRPQSVNAGTTRLRSIEASARLSVAPSPHGPGLPGKLMAAEGEAYLANVPPVGPATVFFPALPLDPLQANLDVMVPVALPPVVPQVEPPAALSRVSPCTVVGRIGTGPLTALDKQFTQMHDWTVSKGINVQPRYGLIVYNPWAAPESFVWELLLPVLSSQPPGGVANFCSELKAPPK